MQIGLGFLFGALIALLAWQVHALSPSGALAAAVTGGLIFGLGGWSWAILLMTFFVSSSLLSRLFRKRKIALDEKFSKGSQRDWGQVLANGGLGALLALSLVFTSQPAWLWAAFAGTMAAVNADTWATELGVLSTIPPRLITSGKFVDRGTSGGVTPLGYAAVLAGSALVGAAALLFTSAGQRLGLFSIALASGLAGSTVDSLLGATVQAMYCCPACHKITERHPNHSCGTPTTLERGWGWLNNDLVNFTCSLVGALVGAGLWKLFF